MRVKEGGGSGMPDKAQEANPHEEKISRRNLTREDSEVEEAPQPALKANKQKREVR